GFPDEPLNGHYNIYMDGTIYSNKPGVGDMMLYIDSVGVYGDAEEQYIFVEWSRGPLLGWFHYKLQLPDSLREMIYLETTVYNNTLDLHIVGIYQYMDIKVNENDNPQLFLPTGVQELETAYTEPPYPGFWVAFEESLHQDTVYSYSQGVIFGRNGIPSAPAKVAFGNALHLDAVEWDYLPTGETLTDLATGIWWPLVELEAYAFCLEANYYGGGFPGPQPSVETRMLNKPLSFHLKENYPNPFNHITTIPYTVNKRDFYQMTIYNIEGTLIRVLVADYISPGEYKISWEGQDLNSGVYFVKLQSSRQSETIKLIYLK
ncbi:T9SS type A sorting domain-containing protein, partial [bacterium]|nr:T9SS type A sorting domain-containing protein [bacterium]